MVSLTSVSIDPWKGAHYGQQSRYGVPALVEWWDWWERRALVTQEPPVRLERVTYHMNPRWIAAIKEEAERTGDSQAAVVDRMARIWLFRSLISAGIHEHF